MKSYSFGDITKRQMKTLAHTLSTIGGRAEQVHFFSSEKKVTDLYPVDIAMLEPTEIFPYHIVTTVGLSAFKFMKDVARAELILMLPLEWKTTFSKKEYLWPINLLQDIAFNVIKNEVGVLPYQVYQTTEKEPYETTEYVGGIVNFPEFMPLEFIDEKIDFDYTRFYQLVPITAKQHNKIADIGAEKFIRFDLHDANGPLLNISLPDVRKNAAKKIDKIISHNERKLKGK